MTAAAHLLVLDAGDLPAEVLDATAAHEPCGDVTGCLQRAGELRDAGVAVVLALVGPAASEPLSVAQWLRRGDPELGLILVPPEDAAADVAAKLAFLPEINDAQVVAANRSDLAAEIADIVDRQVALRQTRRALDRMNAGLLASSADVDEEHRRYRITEQYLAALTKYAPDPILSVDLDGRIVACNDAGSMLLGDVTGRDLVSCVAPADVGGVTEILTGAAAGDPGRRTVRVHDGAGEVRVTSMTAAPVHGVDAVAGLVVLVHDVTDQYHTAMRLQQLQKAESLATLAGGVAHDFNNLLVSISGWAEIARDDLADPDGVALALDRITAAAHRAADLARQMLAYSGRGQFELEPVHLGQLVEGLEQLLRSSVDADVTMVFETADAVPVVMADATQLRQVLLNLVVNAAEAIAGPGTIWVRTATTVAAEPVAGAGGELLPPGRYVALEVVDDGPGLAPDTVPRLFDPFFTTKFTGRGLGLPAAHGIVTAHGGAIEVSSTPGERTTFRVLLPIVKGV